MNSVQGMKRELGHKYFGVLKTNHAGTPKDEIDKIMKDWPSGSSSCMECIMSTKYSCVPKSIAIARKVSLNSYKS